MTTWSVLSSIWSDNNATHRKPDLSEPRDWMECLGLTLLCAPFAFVWDLLTLPFWVVSWCASWIVRMREGGQP